MTACASCGRALRPEARFCGGCGAPARVVPGRSPAPGSGAQFSVSGPGAPLLTTAKTRHPVVTVWLWLIIVVNALLGIASLVVFFGFFGLFSLSGVSGYLVLYFVSTAALFANVAFGVALLKWLKWGFWGFVGCMVLALVVNVLLHVSPLRILGGPTSLAVLYGVLQIGSPRSAWAQLE